MSAQMMVLPQRHTQQRALHCPNRGCTFARCAAEPVHRVWHRWGCSRYTSCHIWQVLPGLCSARLAARETGSVTAGLPQLAFAVGGAIVGALSLAALFGLI